MARPLSEEKRKALLEAATEVVSDFGLSAPTAKIAKLAGVGDGTLFVYFPTKEHLFNQLYLYIKEDFRRTIRIDSDAPIHAEFRRFWDAYVDWGMNFPKKYVAARYLNSWESLLDETRLSAWNMFPDFRELVRAGVKERKLLAQPEEFVGQLIDSIANMIIEHCQSRPREIDEWRNLGWQAFWNAVRLASQQPNS